MVCHSFFTSSTNTENQSRLHLPYGDTRSNHVAMPQKPAHGEHALAYLINGTKVSGTVLHLVRPRGNPREVRMLQTLDGSRPLHALCVTFHAISLPAARRRLHSSQYLLASLACSD